MRRFLSEMSAGAANEDGMDGCMAWRERERDRRRGREREREGGVRPDLTAMMECRPDPS